MGLAVWPVVMKTRLLVRLLWSFSLAAFRPAGFAQTAALTPFDLRCDSAENPLGVDSAPPRLSWKLRSEVRGAKQSAWQVLVASTAENLAANRGDVWDSGRVMSDEQLGTRFAGPALRSSERVFWKVRGWDAAGTASTWSSPATWTIGVLTLPEWQAQWIAHPGQLGRSRSQLGFHSEETREANITKWLQLDLGASRKIDAVSLHALRHTVVERTGFPRRFKLEVDDDAAMSNPRLILDATANDFASERGSDFSIPARGVVGRHLRLTATQLRVSAGVACLAFSQIQVIADGTNIAGGARVSASDSWERGPWSAAAVVDGLENISASPEDSRTIVLRRQFAVRDGLRRALVNGCGLGQHEISLNGAKVSDWLLTPGWTDTTKTCLYDTHDITAALRPGANALTFTLAGGMYRVPPAAGRYAKFTSALRPLVAIARIQLDYADGTSEIIGTDGRWEAAWGPVTFAHMFGGEDYDARIAAKELDWQPAVVGPAPGGVLRGASQAAPPMAAHETIPPVTVKALRPGVAVYDLGQNVSLMPRLRVHGPAGAEVKIIPAELLKPDGSVERGSAGGGQAWWRYTLRGSTGGAMAEAWFPSFFYHGTRYLQVEVSAPAGSTLPVVDALEGVVVHTASPAVGEFACSDDLFNRIRTLIRWAQRSNLVSVITDCPHRERLGWLEQYHLNGPALRYEFDLTRLYAKCFGDMADAQTAEGLVPDIAPEYVKFSAGFRDSPEWGSAFILATWQHRLWTGDESPLRQHFDAMQRYVGYLAGTSKAHIVSHGLGDWYDIGPGRPGKAQLTPVALTATAFYFDCAKTLAAIGRVIGRADDAARLEARASEIKAAFNREFFHPDTGSYATGSQTSNALPLVMEIADSAQRGRVLDALVNDVHGRGNAVTAGDVGYRYLLRALADGGRSDVIFAMNHQSEKPGYGYQLAQGATSLTEAWSADRSSSQNHFMLGQIMEWFYHDLAGLAPDPATPGWKRAIIRPQPAGDITWARAAHESPRGKFASSWKREGGRFVLEVTVPPGATATVFVPTSDASKVTEGGTPAAGADGVHVVRTGPGVAMFTVESGRYVFDAPR